MKSHEVAIHCAREYATGSDYEEIMAKPSLESAVAFMKQMLDVGPAVWNMLSEDMNYVAVPHSLIDPHDFELLPNELTPTNADSVAFIRHCQNMAVLCCKTDFMGRETWVHFLFITE